MLSDYVAERISLPDLDILIAYLKQAESNHDLYLVIDEIWKGLETDKPLLISSGHLYDSILNDPRIKKTTDDDRLTTNMKRKNTRLWWYKSMAASLFIGIALYLLFLPVGHKPESHTEQLVRIMPGGKKATLTLANGQTIDLTGASAGQIAEESGVAIRKTKNGQLIYWEDAAPTNQGDKIGINKIVTPKGGEYQIVLPDGTKVWLNAASALSYPSRFSGDTREVNLQGEAYFEVTKGKPFIVVADHQRIDVLGTKFNVSAYQDDKQRITSLLEGAVRVTNAANRSMLLKPGEQAAVVPDKTQIDLTTFSPEEVLGWKNGYFTFNNTPIKSVMKIIARWYDIDIFYEGDAINKVNFGGTISRFDRLEKLLNTISLTGSVKFRVEGRRVVVMI